MLIFGGRGWLNVGLEVGDWGKGSAWKKYLKRKWSFPFLQFNNWNDLTWGKNRALLATQYSQLNLKEKKKLLQTQFASDSWILTQKHIDSCTECARLHNLMHCAPVIAKLCINYMHPQTQHNRQTDQWC